MNMHHHAPIIVPPKQKSRGVRWVWGVVGVIIVVGICAATWFAVSYTQQPTKAEYAAAKDAVVTLGVEYQKLRSVDVHAVGESAAQKVRTDFQNSHRTYFDTYTNLQSSKVANKNDAIKQELKTFAKAQENISTAYAIHKEATEVVLPLLAPARERTLGSDDGKMRQLFEKSATLDSIKQPVNKQYADTLKKIITQMSELQRATKDDKRTIPDASQRFFGLQADLDALAHEWATALDKVHDDDSAKSLQQLNAVVSTQADLAR